MVLSKQTIALVSFQTFICMNLLICHRLILLVHLLLMLSLGFVNSCCIRKYYSIKLRQMLLLIRRCCTQQLPVPVDLIIQLSVIFNTDGFTTLEYHLMLAYFTPGSYIQPSVITLQFTSSLSLSILWNCFHKKK